MATPSHNIPSPDSQAAIPMGVQNMSTDTTTAPLPSAVSHGTRRACADALIRLSARIVIDGATLLELVPDLMKGEPVAGRLKRYAMGQSRGAEALKVAESLIALEAGVLEDAQKWSHATGRARGRARRFAGRATWTGGRCGCG